MKQPKIILSPFCKERDQRSCLIPLENILPEIRKKFSKAKKGYREGVLLVPISTKNFLSRLVKLQEGDLLHGSYHKRKDGEEPRKDIKVEGVTQTEPLVAVDVVLYHRDVLTEGNQNSDLSADYEVITVLSKITKEDQPMPPDTLMANHFLVSGGTSTQMDDNTFVAALKESFHFWKDKALLP